MGTPITIIQSIAERLDRAWRTKMPIAPLSESEGISDVSAAYAIQWHWTNIRLRRGEQIAGRKIGLTNGAVQHQQLGVNERDYGTLWKSSFYEAKDGKVTMPASDFMQPRIEGEVAFLICKPLREPNITADWKLQLVDTIADNACTADLRLGRWDKKLRDSDLSALAMSIRKNGALAGEGLGSAVLGNPAIATAWLANKLVDFGVCWNLVTWSCPARS
jgi:2-keto-4-pentenoate hydratase